MKNKRVILGFLFSVYFCIDMMVGYSYWVTIQKINQLIGECTYHYAAPAPLVNIVLYRAQIDLFKTIPQFSMVLFNQALVESVISLLLFMTVAFVVLGVQVWRDNDGTGAV